MSDVNLDDLTVDFTDVQGGDFDAIPSGKYHIAITDYSTTETKNAGKLPVGTPGINWEFTVQEGPFENRKLWTNHWIHPNTLGFLKGMLKASGKFSDEELEGQLPKGWYDRAVGAELVAKVGTREYNGNDVNDIKGFKPMSTWEGESTSGGSLLP